METDTRFSASMLDRVLSMISGCQIGVRLHSGPAGPVGLDNVLTTIAYTQFSYPVYNSIANLGEVFFDVSPGVADSVATVATLWFEPGDLIAEYILECPFPEMRLAAGDSVSVSRDGFRISLPSIS